MPCITPFRDNQIEQRRSPVASNDKDAMVPAHVPSVDSVVCHEVPGLVSCTLDDLLQKLPIYPWAQMFASVDRLSRQGTLLGSRIEDDHPDHTDRSYNLKVEVCYGYHDQTQCYTSRQQAGC